MAANPSRQKCQINAELNEVKCMISFEKFNTSSKMAVPPCFSDSERENSRMSNLKKEIEGEGNDRLTNKKKEEDKYMIYIYFLYIQFVILFVIIRHCNEQLRRIRAAYGSVWRSRGCTLVWRASEAKTNSADICGIGIAAPLHGTTP